MIKRWFNHLRDWFSTTSLNEGPVRVWEFQRNNSCFKQSIFSSQYLKPTGYFEGDIFNRIKMNNNKDKKLGTKIPKF
jgi:hypothetical protein